MPNWAVALIGITLGLVLVALGFRIASSRHTRIKVSPFWIGLVAVTAGAMPLNGTIVHSLLAVMFGTGAVGLFCFARDVVRDRNARLGRQARWLPLNERWIGIGTAVLLGLLCLALSGNCLYLALS